jgi:Cu/Ag efflux protein CusF
LLLGLALSLASVTVSVSVSAEPGNVVSYSARGVVKAFGPDRKSVDIAHEAIPGFMGAMTMSFEAREPKQLRPFSVGDRVDFTFEVRDGRRILRGLAKRV